MERRLIKVATELNVGLHTIVEYLNGKGFDIEDKPNAKVTDAMYVELQKEYQKSVDIKEKADSLVIGNRPVAPPTTPVPPKKDQPAVPLNKPTDQPVEDQSAEEAKEERQVPRLKILGKINLEDRLKSRLKGGSQPEEAPKPAPQAVADPEPVAPPPVMEPPTVPVVEKQPTPAPTPSPVPEPPTAKEEASPKVVTPPVVPAVVPPAVATPVEVTPPVVASPPVSEPKEVVHERPQTPKQVQPQAPAPIPQPSEPAPTPVVATPGDDIMRAEAPELRGLKILGKIELDSRSRGGRGGKKEKEREKPKPGQPAAGGGDANKPRPAGAAAGTATPGAAAPAGGAAGTDADNRRKRKRKRKKLSGDDKPAGQQGQQGQGNNNQGNNNNNQGHQQGHHQGGQQGGNQGNNQGGGQHSHQGGGGNRQGGGGPHNQGGNRPNTQSSQTGNRGPIKRPDTTTSNNNNNNSQEVSQREIEEKIKATMARLSGGGKKKRQKLRRDNRERLRGRQEERDAEGTSDKLQVTEFISVQELANVMDIPVVDVITTCLNLGVIVGINQRLDAEIIELVASEFGHEVEFISVEEQLEGELDIDDDPDDLEPRAPIVTVMGHVDHGKTSLLDYIRKANVVSGEAGGITQHIGAYEVEVGPDKKKITFLDTPGHEAFTAMRARGAKVTDIAVIIVAADDSVMPQTREAISHATAAGVPIVFAINKIDKPGANPEKIKQDLAAMNYLVESWGGKYQSQDISAKSGVGIEELLEKILLEAEMLDLKANPERLATGTVIEASLDKGRGYVTKLLVQSGTLNIGDVIVAGEYSGKVKAMFNERNKRSKDAGPSSPVLVLGLSGAPQAGERFKAMESEQDARQLAMKRAQISREQVNRATKRISLDEIGRRLALGNFKELNVIVKGDVDGSVEALSDALIKQSHETVQVKAIHKAVGQITESDILLASASDAIIIGFQVRPSANARKLAEREGVEIKLYSIIYEAIQEIRAAIEGMLEPTKEESIVTQVQVRDVFKISKVGTVAGCYVEEGKITRNTHIRLIRDGIVVFPTREGAIGEIDSLKRFKDDVKEVRAGMECGITIKNCNDIQVGDTIEGYEIKEIKQKLI